MLEDPIKKVGPQEHGEWQQCAVVVDMCTAASSWGSSVVINGKG